MSTTVDIPASTSKRNRSSSNGTNKTIPPKASAQKDPPKPAPNTRQEKFLLKDVVIGAKDKRGREIVDVLWAVPDFKIYKTREGISPHFSDNDDQAVQQRVSYLGLGQELSHLNHLINLQSSRWLQLVPKFLRLNTDSSRNYYEREMARGFAQAFSDQKDQGKETLEALAGRLEKRLRNHGRVMYFGVCVSIAIVITAIAVFFVGDKLALDRNQLTAVLVMGSMGALLSTAVGLRKLKIDASAGLFMNWIYGAQRMLVGVLGAVVLYLAVKAGVTTNLIPLDSVATSDGASLDTYKLSFFSVLAGFTERLVPDLLNRNPNDEDKPE